MRRWRAAAGGGGRGRGWRRGKGSLRGGDSGVVTLLARPESSRLVSLLISLELNFD